MAQKRITNMSSMSVVIEDIGVRLNGRGSTVIIDAGLLASSKLINQVSSLLLIEDYRPAPAIWPFATNPPPTVTKIKSDRKPPEPPKVAVPANQSLDLSPLTDRLDKLVSLMSNPQVVYQSGAEAPSHRFSAPSVPPPDLVFIPSSILPTDATSSLQVKTEELANSDISDSVAALRRMKGKL